VHKLVFFSQKTHPYNIPVFSASEQIHIANSKVNTTTKAARRHLQVNRCTYTAESLDTYFKSFKHEQLNKNQMLVLYAELYYIYVEFHLQLVLRQQNFRQNFTRKFPETFGTKVWIFLTKLNSESFLKISPKILRKFYITCTKLNMLWLK